jgi:hypothetical protein
MEVIRDFGDARSYRRACSFRSTTDIREKLIKFSVFRVCSSHLAAYLIACVILLSVPVSAVAEELLLPGLPGKNVNIVGPTPDAAHVPDILLRQQNEPSCTIRPGSPAFIICAYNDYRATDFPGVQGDSWIGVSMSADFGKTWFSRLAPGFRSSPTSLNLQFAADPNFVSVPGNSPGIAILNYIAASRDLDDGVMAIQRWAVMPQEDVNYYLPENRIFTADLTNNGRFADKPTMIAVVDPPKQQTTQTITMTLEKALPILATRSLRHGVGQTPTRVSAIQSLHRCRLTAARPGRKVKKQQTYAQSTSWQAARRFGCWISQ